MLAMRRRSLFAFFAPFAPRAGLVGSAAFVMAALAAHGCGGRAPDDVAGDGVIAGHEGEGDAGEGEGEGEDDPAALIAAAVAADLDLNLATGAQIAVWRNDEIEFIGAFGARDATTGDPVTRATQFCIGSDTKKITATAALRRVQSGDLTLATTVNDVLPDLAFSQPDTLLGTATLHDLISHQGGGLDWFEFDTTTSDDELRERAFGAFAQDTYSMAPPGTFYNYSNPNFSLTGLMVQEVSSAPYADIVEDEIFAPLGMSDTIARKTEVGAEGAGGTGYASTSSPFAANHTFADTWETAFVRPAGMVWSTAEDQMKVARFLVDGDPAVLSDELRHKISTAQAPAYPDLPGAYGYGLFVFQGLTLGDTHYDVPVWSHGGNTLLHTSTFYVLPEQRFAISILSNGYGDDFTQTVTTAMKALVTNLPEPVAAPPPASLPTADELAALTGVYSDPNNVGDITVAATETGLSMTMPTLEDFGIPYEPDLTPISARVYLGNLQGSLLVVSFWEGPDGSTYFATRSFVAVRPGADAASASGRRRSTSHANPERLANALARTPPPSMRAVDVFGPTALLPR
jgi:CubicO group peptidase (beta-lactamase class C family)